MESDQQEVFWVQRAPAVLALLAAAATAFAFLHLSFWWTPSPDFFRLGRYFTGWPLPFSRYSLSLIETGGGYWSDAPGSFQLTSTWAAVCDLFLAIALVDAVAVTVYRLVRRVLASLQFSIADMLALTTAVAMVLGVAHFDDRVRSVPDLYTPICALHPFDRVMVLSAIGCAVAFVFSSLIARLGSASGGETSKTLATATREDNKPERADDDRQR
jgi:hypothetical protein